MERKVKRTMAFISTKNDGDKLLIADAIEWADKTMIDKATQWLFEHVYDYTNPEDQERVEAFRKYLEE